MSGITYSGIQRFFWAEPELATANTVVTEVGGGATEVLLVKNGNVHFPIRIDWVRSEFVRACSRNLHPAPNYLR